MKAILLAAGVGSRIADEIGQQPKSMLEVNGKPIIVHTVELLQKNHIEVTVITGYKHRIIEEALRGHKVTIYYNPFYRVTNSIGSLWYARDEFNTNEIIIANADVYYTQELLNLIFKETAENFLLEDVNRAQVGDYFFESQNGILQSYGKDLPQDKRNSEYVGIAILRNNWVRKFHKRLCDMIENEKYSLWWENVLYSFVGQEEIHTLDVDGIFWSEVDTMQDYQRVTRYINEPNKQV